MSKQPTKEEFEEVRKDLRKIYGLFIMRHQKINKFFLLSVLKDGQITGLNPSPEVLRLYARKEDKSVHEWVDLCTTKSHKEVDAWLQKIAALTEGDDHLCPHIRVVFSLDECETIQHFDLPNQHTIDDELNMFDMMDKMAEGEEQRPSTPKKE